MHMKIISNFPKIVSSCLIALAFQGVCSFAKAEPSPLHNQGWQLISLDGVGFKSDALPYFVFDEKGNVYGYGICNYFIGKFKSDASDEFLLTKLKRSNQPCEGDDDEIETRLMAAMLMSNRFEVDENQLTLMSDEQATLGFSPKPDLNKSELVKAATKVKARIGPSQSPRTKGKKTKAKKKTTTNKKVAVKKINKTASAKH
jgi:heat shock protein HslJ